MLLGRCTGPDTYLLDDNRHKRHSDRDKATVHSELWRHTFQDNDVDDDNPTVINYMNENIHRTSPFHTADTDRLTGQTHLDCEISSVELTDVIRGSKMTCSGSSKINKNVLSHLPGYAWSRLRNVFNAALSAGYFPDRFKAAEMRMIVKPGKVPTLPDRYRPISLLEVPGKLLERVLERRFRVHLEKSDLYNEEQYGFRRGRGTTSAIAIPTETLALHEASGYKCNLVLRDVSKAFEKVWHLGLKYKLPHLGLPASMENLLCDFLEDTSARIKIASHLSPSFSVQTGVPQGSVLSPTLYSIFTHDCPGSLAGISLQYEDDITQVVFHPGRSGGMLTRRTEREITRVNAYEGE